MNIAVAQSGGPTCAINASLVGVFRESLKEPTIDAIFGSINGVEGIIHDHLIDLKTMILTNEDMELLRQTPSTVLGSCRYKLPEIGENDEVYNHIFEILYSAQTTTVNSLYIVSIDFCAKKKTQKCLFFSNLINFITL